MRLLLDLVGLAKLLLQIFGVTPDIISCAKAITNELSPWELLLYQKIHDMMDEADMPIELFHGYTYSGHPIASAAGLAALLIFIGMKICLIRLQNRQIS